jgi:hypothetical protein
MQSAGSSNHVVSFINWCFGLVLQVCTPVIIPYIVILLHVQVTKLVIIPCIAILVIFFSSGRSLGWYLAALFCHVPNAEFSQKQPVKTFSVF